MKKLPQFDISFTSDNKNQLYLLDKYEELSSCKRRFDEVTAMKIKEEKLSGNSVLNKNEDGEKPSTFSLSFNLSNPRGRPKSSVKDNN